MLNTEDTALLLAVMLRRSGKTRGRISDITLKTISKRKHLRAAFRNGVADWTAEFGVQMYPLERGGYGLLAASSLEGAPVLKAAELLKKELAAFKKTGTLKHDALYEELGLEVDETEE
ncbi:hypothetical protein VPK21_004355 [Sinorhizobium kummerowiae]|uniref:Uncharacterized protein n=1 Tax=Sinorhizobium kummerowiae TaxID=158892 RepID=A0ABY8T902_9HYPH|nr:hypothetical protein [Sinorhizobium kummerowiae]WHS94234.1 hypothetical protein PZL22_001939 [Sinorhizobium kummerowiae]WRW46162.1 hypothetical protein VPK21_004355 [Sinorhizobium kummerowiae]